jgi:hypothetical protein
VVERPAFSPDSVADTVTGEVAAAIVMLPVRWPYPFVRP